MRQSVIEALQMEIDKKKDKAPEETTKLWGLCLKISKAEATQLIEVNAEELTRIRKALSANMSVMVSGPILEHLKDADKSETPSDE